MRDEDIVKIVDDVISEIDKKLKKYPECYILFYKYYDGKENFKVDMQTDIKERFSYQVDTVTGFIDTVHSLFLLNGEIPEYFLNVLAIRSTYDIMTDGYDVESKVSINDFIFKCSEAKGAVDEEMNELIGKVTLNTIILYVLRYVISYIDSRLRIIFDMFKDDFESAIKLKPKKGYSKIRYAPDGKPIYKKGRYELFLDNYFSSRYGITYYDAGEIYNSLNEKLKLYYAVIEILKRKKKEYKELPIDLLKRVASFYGIGKRPEYCSNEWIEAEVSFEEKTLKSLGYDDFVIKSQIKVFRKFITDECEKYKKQLEEEEKKKAEERAKKFRYK